MIDVLLGMGAEPKPEPGPYSENPTYRELGRCQVVRFTRMSLGCINVLIRPVITEIPEIAAQPGSQKGEPDQRIFCVLVLKRRGDSVAK
jgi:hypothetical protein